jgi:glutathione S-transferase
MKPTLYIGERNYSSWSLRPWLVLKWSNIAFEERFLSLDQPGYGEGKIAAIAAVSPSGRVPALHSEGLAVWDSLAIAEWVAEKAPDAALWPRDAAKRAQARAVSCEMHSGFVALRRDLPMNIRRRCPSQDWADDARIDIARMEAIFTRFRNENRQAGPYLFGAQSIADAFFTPVATRFRTYSVSLGRTAQDYCDTLLADEAFKAWERLALAEWKAPFSRALIDGLYT